MTKNDARTGPFDLAATPLHLGDERVAPLPGDTVVDPAGIWHTADVVEPTTALYLTPCPGTEHRPR